MTYDDAIATWFDRNIDRFYPGRYSDRARVVPRQPDTPVYLEMTVVETGYCDTCAGTTTGVSASYTTTAGESAWVVTEVYLDLGTIIKEVLAISQEDRA